MPPSAQSGRFWLINLLAAVVVFAVTGQVLGWVGDRVRLGVDTHRVTCLPWRLYWIYPGDRHPPIRGELVQIRAQGLAPRFPDGTRLTKLVAGIPGDDVRIEADQLWINDQYWGRLWLLPVLGQAPGSLDRQYRIPDGTFLPMGTTAEAYDGRYFGTLDESCILGRALPIL